MTYFCDLGKDNLRKKCKQMRLKIWIVSFLRNSLIAKLKADLRTVSEKS